MTISSRPIPVHYFGQAVTTAVVDGTLVQELDPRWKFRVEVPVTLRRRGYPADVIAAMIHEDESTAKLCHPIITITGVGVVTIRLSRIVLRPAMIEYLNQIIAYPRSNPRKETLIFECMRLCKQINRVVFCNQDRRDCQLANLREITSDLPLDDNLPNLFEME